MKSIVPRWFRATPLGMPVDPEVWMMQSGSVSITVLPLPRQRRLVKPGSAAIASSTSSSWESGTPAARNGGGMSPRGDDERASRFCRMALRRSGGDFRSRLA